MARKRKTDAAPRLDEADRTLYSTFCGAANSLSQLYSQAMSQQKLSFQAGERHAFVRSLSRLLPHLPGFLVWGIGNSIGPARANSIALRSAGLDGLTR
jgi:hypothetical protein